MPARQTAWQGAANWNPRARVAELGLLALLTAALGTGAWLLWLAQTAQIAAAEQAVASGQACLLNRSVTAEHLRPFVEEIETEAGAAKDMSEAIAAYAAEHDFSHVGALAAIPGKAGAATKTLLTASQISRLKTHLNVRTGAEYWTYTGRRALALLVMAWAVHLLWTFVGFRGSQLLLPLVMALTGTSILVMWGMMHPLRDTMKGGETAWSATLGLVVLAVCSLWRWDKWGRHFEALPLLGALGLCVALQLWGTGPTGSGAKVNLSIGGTQIQPAEVVKLLFLLFLCAYLHRNWELLRSAHGTGRTGLLSLPRWQDALPLAAGAGSITLLYFMQRDNGPALIMGAVSLALFSLARGRWLLAATAPVALVAAGYWMTALFPSKLQTVTKRIEIWSSPWDNLARGGTQIAEALWGFSAGKLWGQGLGLDFSQVIPNGITDLMGAVVAETLGFAGFGLVVLWYALLTLLGMKIARQAQSPYEMFLAMGIALLIALQALLILMGTLGLIPLSGVTPPFVGYGQVSLTLHMCMAGMLAGISSRRVTAEHQARAVDVAQAARPWRPLAAAVGAGFVSVAVAAGWYQLVVPEETALRDVTTLPRYGKDGQTTAIAVSNPRLAIVERDLGRGTVYDRKRIPLATSDLRLVKAHEADYRAMGVDPAQTVRARDRRHYPLGDYLFELIGDRRSELQYDRQVERAASVVLRGFREPRELLPLLYRRHAKDDSDVRAILERNRDITLTVDAAMQMALFRAFETELERQGKRAGSFVLLDDTGGLLAAGSLPRIGDGAGDFLDRWRSGWYVVGSPGKLLTAMTAVRAGGELANLEVQCARVPGGVGAKLPSGRIMRCAHKHPHGWRDLAGATVVSCNGYFATLAERAGAVRTMETLRLFSAKVGRGGEASAEAIRGQLGALGIGQGELTASPLEVARWVLPIANGGMLYKAHFVNGEGGEGVRILKKADSYSLARAMHGVTSSNEGTGARLQKYFRLPAGGKTGTAERESRTGEALPSHSWFAGFAPYGPGHEGQRVVFTVMVEEGGFGASSALPAAGKLLAECERLGYFEGGTDK